jgi:hypothetical protein
MASSGQNHFRSNNELGTIRWALDGLVRYDKFIDNSCMKIMPGSVNAYINSVSRIKSSPRLFNEKETKEKHNHKEKDKEKGNFPQ